MICTIVAIDLEGYSAIASKIEATLGQEGLSIFERRFHEVIEAGVRLTNRDMDDAVFKYTGDGALLRFNSGAAAIQCAERIQHAARELNRRNGLAAMNIRVGIATGEVGRGPDAKDLSGFTITRATRLESACKCGSILVDSDTRDQLSSTFRAGCAGPFEVEGKRGEVFTCYEVGVPDPTEETSEAPASAVAVPGFAEAQAPQPDLAPPLAAIADEQYGAYVRSHYAAYEGDYVFCRRSFDHDDKVVLAALNIAWDDALGGFCFTETQSNVGPDGRVHKRSFSGAVHIPPTIGLVQLVSENKGMVRVASLTILREDRDNTMIGALSALAQPGELGFRLAVSPVVLMKTNAPFALDKLGVYGIEDEGTRRIVYYMKEAEQLFFQMGGDAADAGSNSGVIVSLNRWKPRD